MDLIEREEAIKKAKCDESHTKKAPAEEKSSEGGKQKEGTRRTEYCLRKAQVSSIM